MSVSSLGGVHSSIKWFQLSHLHVQFPVSFAELFLIPVEGKKGKEKEEWVY